MSPKMSTTKHSRHFGSIRSDTVDIIGIFILAQ